MEEKLEPLGSCVGRRASLELWVVTEFPLSIPHSPGPLAAPQEVQSSGALRHLCPALTQLLASIGTRPTVTQIGAGASVYKAVGPTFTPLGGNTGAQLAACSSHGRSQRCRKTAM